MPRLVWSFPRNNPNTAKEKHVQAVLKNTHSLVISVMMPFPELAHAFFCGLERWQHRRRFTKRGNNKPSQVIVGLQDCRISKLMTWCVVVLLMLPSSPGVQARLPITCTAIMQWNVLPSRSLCLGKLANAAHLKTPCQRFPSNFCHFLQIKQPRAAHVAIRHTVA